MHSVHVTDSTGTVHYGEPVDMTTDDLTRMEDALRDLGNLTLFSLDTPGGTVYFNPAHVVCAQVVET